jgi:hypothetical protein
LTFAATRGASSSHSWHSQFLSSPIVTVSDESLVHSLQRPRMQLETFLHSTPFSFWIRVHFSQVSQKGRCGWVFRVQSSKINDLHHDHERTQEKGTELWHFFLMHLHACQD